MEVRAVREAPTLRVREVDSDAALVAAAREEPRMFLALYDRYFDRVLGYVRLRIGDAATCEDVTSVGLHDRASAARSLARRRRLRGLVVPDRAERGA